jgi:hypothetical protein
MNILLRFIARRLSHEYTQQLCILSLKKKFNLPDGIFSFKFMIIGPEIKMDNRAPEELEKILIIELPNHNEVNSAPIDKT